MATFNFHLGELPLEAQKIREEIRDFLNRELGDRSAAKRALSWGGFDRDFSRKLGTAGYIGLTWPKKYGGHERTALERYVVLEESLAAGAPTSAHWVADRQSGPLLLRFGTEAQRERFLPRIAKGELAFAIGMVVYEFDSEESLRDFAASDTLEAMTEDYEARFGGAGNRARFTYRQVFPE